MESKRIFGVQTMPLDVKPQEPEPKAKTADELREEWAKIISRIESKLPIFRRLAVQLFKDSDLPGLDKIQRTYEPQSVADIQTVIGACREFLQARDYLLRDKRMRGSKMIEEKEIQLTEKQLEAFKRYLELGVEIKNSAIS